MRRAPRTLAAAALGLVLSAGCAVPKDAGFPEVRAQVGDRTGFPPLYDQGSAEDRLVEETVREILAQPLTMERAIEVGLLNSPELQMRYAALGIAQADLVQAGLVANPRIAASVKIPTQSGLAPIVEGGLAWSFASLLTMPAKKRIAAARFEAVKLEIADVVIVHIAAVKRAFLAAQVARDAEAAARVVAELEQGAFDTAAAMHRSGGLDELAFAERQADYERARLDLVSAQTETLAARERLDRLLGLWGGATDWRLDAPLRALPAEEVPLDGLETRAVGQRFDLAAARGRTDAAARALQAAGDWGWLGDLDIGADFKRDESRSTFVGPAAGLSLPIFDHGQAGVAHMRAELRRSWFEVTHLAIGIRSEVRELRATLVAHRRRAEHFRDVVVPLRQRMVRLAAEQYNFMLTGAFELIDAKRREIEAARDLTRELGAYWTARADLERAVGGRLP
jgi:outer membrane protein, heavy metal efflux system